MTEEESNSESLVERQTTGEDRVRMIARQLSEPRTANWIASDADWSHEPIKRILERLVDDGILHCDGTGTHTTYYPIIAVKRYRRPYAFGTAGTWSKNSPNDSPI